MNSEAKLKMIRKFEDLDEGRKFSGSEALKQSELYKEWVKMKNSFFNQATHTSSNYTPRN
jgi:hypothetical protein